MYLTLNRAGRVRPHPVYNGASFDRLFDEFFSPATRVPQVASTLAARFDVVEKADRYEARIEIPGVNKEDIDVRIEGASVRVKAEARTEGASDAKPNVDAEGTDAAAPADAERGAKVLHSNRVTRSWARNFTLPAEVDESRAEAAYENGVLTLTLPKKEVVQATRLAIR